MQIFSGFLSARFSRNVKELCLCKGFGTKRLVCVMNASCSYQGHCGEHEIALRGLKHSHHERRKCVQLCDEILHDLRATSSSSPKNGSTPFILTVNHPKKDNCLLNLGISGSLERDISHKNISFV